LRDQLPAPKHNLAFGLGGNYEPETDQLSGWGFATLTAHAKSLELSFWDPAREAPLYSTHMTRGHPE